MPLIILGMTNTESITWHSDRRLAGGQKGGLRGRVIMCGDDDDDDDDGDDDDDDDDDDDNDNDNDDDDI